MAQIPIYNPTQGLSSAAGPVYGNEPNAVETEASFESDYLNELSNQFGALSEQAEAKAHQEQLQDFQLTQSEFNAAKIDMEKQLLSNEDYANGNLSVVDFMDNWSEQWWDQQSKQHAFLKEKSYQHQIQLIKNQGQTKSISTQAVINQQKKSRQVDQFLGNQTVMVTDNSTPEHLTQVLTNTESYLQGIGLNPSIIQEQLTQAKNELILTAIEANLAQNRIDDADNILESHKKTLGEAYPAAVFQVQQARERLAREQSIARERQLREQEQVQKKILKENVQWQKRTLSAVDAILDGKGVGREVILNQEGFNLVNAAKQGKLSDMELATLPSDFQLRYLKRVDDIHQGRLPIDELSQQQILTAAIISPQEVGMLVQAHKKAHEASFGKYGMANAKSLLSDDTIRGLVSEWVTIENDQPMKLGALVPALKDKPNYFSQTFGEEDGQRILNEFQKQSPLAYFAIESAKQGQPVERIVNLSQQLDDLPKNNSSSEKSGDKTKLEEKIANFKAIQGEEHLVEGLNTLLGKMRSQEQINALEKMMADYEQIRPAQQLPWGDSQFRVPVAQAQAVEQAMFLLQAFPEQFMDYDSVFHNYKREGSQQTDGLGDEKDTQVRERLKAFRVQGDENGVMLLADDGITPLFKLTFDELILQSQMIQSNDDQALREARGVLYRSIGTLNSFDDVQNALKESASKVQQAEGKRGR